MIYTGGRLNKKDRLTGYGDPHVKDKTSYRPSYLWHGNPHTWKDGLLYWDGAQMVLWKKVSSFLLMHWDTTVLHKAYNTYPWKICGNSLIYSMIWSSSSGPWFNIKMSSYQYRKSHCGDKTVVRSSYLHNGISYTGKMTSLYWFGPLVLHFNMLLFCKLGFFSAFSWYTFYNTMHIFFHICYLKTVKMWYGVHYAYYHNLLFQEYFITEPWIM